MRTETATVSAIEVPVAALDYLRPYAREAGYSMTNASVVRFSICRLAEALGKPMAGMAPTIAGAGGNGVSAAQEQSLTA